MSFSAYVASADRAQRPVLSADGANSAQQKRSLTTDSKRSKNLFLFNENCDEVPFLVDIGCGVSRLRNTGNSSNFCQLSFPNRSKNIVRVRQPFANLSGTHFVVKLRKEHKGNCSFFQESHCLLLPDPDHQQHGHAAYGSIPSQNQFGYSQLANPQEQPRCEHSATNHQHTTTGTMA